MRDLNLFARFLELERPWTLMRVEINPSDRRIDVWIGHATGVRWECPACTHRGRVRDHAPERVWRHLDCSQFETFLHARIPRVSCPRHGARQVRVPWAHPDSRLTRLFERRALVLIMTGCTTTGAAMILGLTWDEARGIRERAERRGAMSDGEWVGSSHDPSRPVDAVLPARTAAPSA